MFENILVARVLLYIDRQLTLREQRCQNEHAHCQPGGCTFVF